MVVLVLAGTTTVSAQKSKIHKKKTNYGVGYLEFLPDNYGGGSKFPVILYFHGRGENGNGSSSALEKVMKWGPLNEVVNGSNMCFTVNGKKECFVVIAAQSGGGCSSDFVDKIVDYTLKNYKVDPDRVYLTGLSQGGIGVWNYAYSGKNHPNKIAAIAPVAGTGNKNEVCYLPENKISAWAFHGKKDGTINYQKSKELVDRMNSCKSGSAGLTLYASGGHSKSTWLPAYDSKHSYQSPNMYEWFLKQKKGSSGSTPDPSPAPSGNKPPVANAGSDFNTSSSSVTLNGSNSKDSDGSIKSYRWSKKSGPAVNIQSKTSKSTKVTGLKKGTYVFLLSVTDNKGASASDKVTVTVKSGDSGSSPAPSAGNQKPVAKAGSDKTTSSNAITLNGGSSKDPDGSISKYRWSKVSGGSADIKDKNSKSTKITGLKKGTYVFILKVTDNKGATNTDKVKVVVKSSSSRTTTTIAEKKIGVGSEVLTEKEAGAFNIAKISAYPNPVAERLTLDFGDEIDESVQVNLLDQTGRIVYSKEATLYNESKMELDLGGTPLKTGLLFLQIKPTDGSPGKTIKLIKY